MLCAELLCYIEKRFLYPEEKQEIRDRYPKETKEYDDAYDDEKDYLHGYYQGLYEAS